MTANMILGWTFPFISALGPVILVVVSISSAFKIMVKLTELFRFRRTW